MTKSMLKTLKIACIITTTTGVSAFAVRAVDLTTASAPGTSGYETSASGSHSAKSFIKDAYRDNQSEIDLAQIGMTKAQNADLKSLSQQLQRDHTQANKDLQPLAQKYGVTEDQSKWREHEVNKFDKETAGAEFDKKFATEILKSHQKDVAKFERAAAKIQEPDVKQYAETMLPKLREHLQHAATVAGAVGVDQSTISSALSKSSAVGGTSENEVPTTGTETSPKTDQGAASRDLQPSSPKNQP